MSASDWTPEREIKLRYLWLQGLSCSQIAKELNLMQGGKLTRSAVIGKRVRMGLPDRGARSKPTHAQCRRNLTSGRKPALKKEPAPKPEPQPKAPRDRTPTSSASAVRFSERKLGQCLMFLQGQEGVDGFVCGAPVHFGEWCERCSRVVYAPVPARRVS